MSAVLLFTPSNDRIYNRLGNPIRVKLQSTEGYEANIQVFGGEYDGVELRCHISELSTIQEDA